MLHVHRAERADVLASGLAAVLRDAPPDPFAADVVAVPTRGVERWLAQRLSHELGTRDGPRDGSRDGVCANVRFPSPADVVGAAVAQATGVDAARDPWAAQRAVWTVLEILEESLAQPWAAIPARHLRRREQDEAPAPSRRVSLARRVCALFDSYGAQRPAMVRSWADGADTDADGAPLPDDVVWQAELWRRLRSRTGVPSRAERACAAAAVLRVDRAQTDLPSRLSVFGPTRLPTTDLMVLSALAEHRDVHLWLVHGSPALWDRVASLASRARPDRRRCDRTAGAARHPLLASLARDSRELQARLATSSADATDTWLPSPHPAPTLLGRLQAQLRDDSPLVAAAGVGADTARPQLDAADRSVQVHACHGPARQVEVLRDVVLGLLDADSSLEPRDVLVMCPDIEVFAPLVSAAFGLGGPDAVSSHPAHRLRVRLADRSLGQVNPVLGAVASLLELSDARVTAPQVLDLAAATPVRRRFELDDDDLERLRTWVSRSGVRWGLDARHRSPFRLDAVPQNTWQAGLDRILVGAAMAGDDERWLGLALPLDDVESNDVDLAGRLAELVDRLQETLEDMRGGKTLAAWVDTFSTAARTLMSVAEQDEWQLAQLDRELDDVLDGAGGRAATVVLELSDMRALLAERLRGRPTRANFRTGSLTVATMYPMRSVPHRVVCLLGLDDGVFPRVHAADGDDILARDPLVGERDARSEDRQVLLDAILAAREHLVVLYSGADERTNAPRPPAVPVGELLDVLDATVGTADGAPTRDRIIVHHPLQPFDVRNFTRDSLGRAEPFSHDAAALAGAVATVSPRQDPRPFLARPLPRPDEQAPVLLADLVTFLEHPVRAFLRQRLDLVLPREDEELESALPITLTPLQRWEIGSRLLRARLAGMDPATCRQAEWRRGALPPGRLGGRMLDDLLGEVEPIAEAAATVPAVEASSVDVAVVLRNGRMVSGTVGGVAGDCVRRTEYSRLGPKPRLRAWAQLLALTVAAPSTPWQAVTLGRGRFRGVRRSTLGPVPEPAARTALEQLVDLYDRGMREPLPMAVKTSHEYAAERHSGGSPVDGLAAAREAWSGSREGAEWRDREHALVWGEDAPLETLLAPAPHGDESGDGWSSDESTRFGILARRLWTPLLLAETQDMP